MKKHGLTFACVAALSRLAGEANGAQVNDLAVIAFYFIGRIDGRKPGLNLGAAFEREASQMSHTDYLALPQTCQKQYRLRAEEVNSAAEAMQN